MTRLADVAENAGVKIKRTQVADNSSVGSRLTGSEASAKDFVKTLPSNYQSTITPTTNKGAAGEHEVRFWRL